MYAFIRYATRETTVEEVKDALDQLGEDIVDRIDESITQDYNDYWKSFTIYFKDSFNGKLPFHTVFDRHVLYYTSTDYWEVHMMQEN
jgi:hypothetical protein